MLQKNATVTVCHSKTRNLQSITKNADIIISATGVKGLIKEDMVNNNAVVVDVGITRENGKLYGDVDFDNVSKKASLITPVPGGVGPMTIASLAQNVLKAYKMQKRNDYSHFFYFLHLSIILDTRSFKFSSVSFFNNASLIIFPIS